MDDAHEPIVQVAKEVIERSDLIVRDLGCGDGTLLKKICAVTPWVTPTGCDMDAKAIVDAKLLMPWGHFEHKNMFDGAIWGADVLILMPGRLIEFGMNERIRFVLENSASKLIFYAYGDWLKKPLLQLIREAGFQWSPPWAMIAYKGGNGSAATAFAK